MGAGSKVKRYAPTKSLGRKIRLEVVQPCWIAERARKVYFRLTEKWRREAMRGRKINSAVGGQPRVEFNAVNVDKDQRGKTELNQKDGR